jgi:hypothetical protein
MNNPVQQPDEWVLKTREEFAKMDRAVIEGVRSGSIKCNNVDETIAYYEQSTIDGMNGKYDHTLAFRQKLHYLKTGESVPILSNTVKSGGKK